MHRTRLLALLLTGLASLSCPGSGVLGKSGIFVGTTPCDALLRDFLGISGRAGCDLIRWDLWLALGVNGHPPRLHVTAEFGVAGEDLRRIKRQGSWTIAEGTPEHPDDTVFGIKLGKRQLRLWKVGPETVHFLDAERNLLVGNATHSYSLSTAVNEKPSATGKAADLPHTFTPMVTGATVFGVFEGRTPCGMAQVLGMAAPQGCEKLEWRLTLFQDPDRRVPNRFRLEGELFGTGPREGSLTQEVGTSFNRDATVFRLDWSPGGQPLRLMRGDDNVLFFLDRVGTLGQGNRDYAYALNRRPNNVGLSR